MVALSAALLTRLRQCYTSEQPTRWPGAIHKSPLSPSGARQSAGVERSAPTALGVLPADLLDIVFEILREDEAEYWGYHHSYPHGQRYLATCALVSRCWRDTALRHLLRTLVFTRGAVMEAYGTLNHNLRHRTILCDNLPLAQHEQRARNLRALDGFVRQSSDVQQYTRTLRLRTSPLDVCDRDEEFVDATIVLGLLNILPRITTLHLEDIVLSPPSLTGLSLSLSPAPSLEHLTLGSKLGHAPIAASHILYTLSHFRRISRLRLIHLWEEPRLSAGPRSGSAPRPTVDAFEFERCRFLGDEILTFLADSAADRVTVRTTLPTDVLSAQRLKQFVMALGARLAHLEYTFRVRDMPCPMTLLFSGFDSAAHPGAGAALDLSMCTGLRTLRAVLDLAPARLAFDVASTLVPTLASLKSLPRGTMPLALTLVVSLGEVLAEKPGQHLEARACAFAQLEDAVLELRGSEKVSHLTFEIEVTPDGSVLDDRLAEASGALRILLPRLAANGDLHVVEKVKAGAPRVNAYWGGRYDAPW